MYKRQKGKGRLRMSGRAPLETVGTVGEWCGCSVPRETVWRDRQLLGWGGRLLGVAGDGRLQKREQFGPSNEHFAQTRDPERL